ncbi:hypothetical protein MAGR_08870 [Mycolicibacterium agri]|uniref:Uncharacterized protein n=1 Tax=Mycolicibacterium agri TaxID=36811 RepID=A0A7I9VWS9_MYCAG|nr:hypothetical protein MAGR_08870 [Mycolicibacterium agri]
MLGCNGVSRKVTARIGPTRAGMAAGFQRDHIGADRPTFSAAAIPDHVGLGHAAVQQQDVDEFAGAAASPLTRRAAAQNAS